MCETACQSCQVMSQLSKESKFLKPDLAISGPHNHHFVYLAKFDYNEQIHITSTHPLFPQHQQIYSTG